MRRPLALAIGLASVWPARAPAQCPDGSPPPCRRARTPLQYSVAVLYFENASRDSADSYLAEGLTEAIITQLGRVERLSVMSRSAVRRYRGAELPPPSVIGRTLNVAYFVTGSLQRAGHQLRVSVDVARAATGTRVWGDQFVRADDSLFALQDDVARRVAEGVVGRLLPAERRAVAALRTTGNPKAYEHFLRGDYYLAQRTSTGMIRATAEYRQAAALDSGFVSALARVGLAYALRLDWIWDASGAPAPDSLLIGGMAAAAEALRRDSLNSDAWLARAYLLEFANPRTFDGVMAAFQRSVSLDPHNAEAWHQMGDAAYTMLDDSAAITGLRRALAIDPQRSITLRELAGMGPEREAEAWLDSALAIDPGFLLARFERAGHRAFRGDLTGARSDLEAARCGTCPADMWLTWTAWHAAALHATGDTARARAEADSVIVLLPRTGSLGRRVGEGLASYLVQAGDTSRAFDMLERIEPAGVMLWETLNRHEWPDTPRLRQLLARTSPPWAPAPRLIQDLPTSAAQRDRWMGAYENGYWGRIAVFTRADSVLLTLDAQPVGRLLSQGGDTLIASWDHGMRLIFDPTGDRAPGFTATARKRAFPFHRVE